VVVRRVRRRGGERERRYLRAFFFSLCCRKGELKGKNGLFPSNHVEEINEEKEKEEAKKKAAKGQSKKVLYFDQIQLLFFSDSVYFRRKMTKLIFLEMVCDLSLQLDFFLFFFFCPCLFNIIEFFSSSNL
jgi:hypothetical protein